VAGEAVVEIDKRGPKLAEDAGIMNWRYATLGWITWQVGKRVVTRKAKAAVRSTRSRGARKNTRGGRNG
jgi:hypothetical protein